MIPPRRGNPRRPSSSSRSESGGMRLNRYLAFCGVASRRAAMTLIQEGRVEVNGAITREPGHPVRAGADQIHFDGERVVPPATMAYYAFHKPRGVVVSMQDELGREGLEPFLRRLPEHLFAVGRLDRNSEGILLLTNDGELGHRLLHPRYGVEKVYQVSVSPRPRPGQVRLLSTGVQIGPNESSAPAQVRVRRARARGAVLRMTLKEGKKREVRRMCRAVGLRVNRLKRIQFAGIGLGELPAGKLRRLTSEEIAALRALTEL
jgi:23S rRNA pseudouridine2605 synthase